LGFRFRPVEAVVVLEMWLAELLPFAIGR